MQACTAPSYADAAGQRAKQEEELGISSAALGDNHPTTQVAKSNLGITLTRLGCLPQARELLESALKDSRRIWGRKHPHTVAAMVNLAFTLCAMNAYEEAKELESTVLRLRQRDLGEDHPETRRAMGNLGITMNNIAVSLRNHGNLKDAEPIQFDALTMVVKAFGEGDLVSAYVYSATGALLKLKGDSAQARNYFSKALEIREKKLGKNAVLTQLVRTRLRELLH